MQRIVPYSSNAHPDAAIDWPSGAFGFAEVLRYVEADGTVAPAELEETSYAIRRHRARDPEGHRWVLGQRLRTVAPAEWGATTPERRP